MSHNFANYIPTVTGFRTIAAGQRVDEDAPGALQWVLLEVPYKGFTLQSDVDQSPPGSDWTDIVPAEYHIIDSLGFWEFTPSPGRIGRMWTRVEMVGRRILATSYIYRDC